MLQIDELENKINLICYNINNRGLLRYDPRDIDEWVNKVPYYKFKRIMSVFLQLLELINPYWVRRMIGSKKRLYPTTYTFLIESLICSRERLSLEYTVSELIELCLHTYYADNGWWKFKENKSFYPIFQDMERPSMPLYMLARCNNILARYGKNTQNKRLICISEESLHYIFMHHKVSYYDDGTESISYYYNSDDCTINVNAEVVDWMCQLERVMENEKYKKHFIKILKMIINEQNANGSWYYYSKRHMERYKLNGTIDCHHTASTLYNMIHVYETAYLDKKQKKKLENVINNGMEYFLDNFFDENGKGICIIGMKRRASTVQYSEALIAIGEYIRVFEEKNGKIVVKAKKLIDKVAVNIIKLVKNDGSAPGDYKIWYINLDNINWGNGPALYALTYYREYKRKCENKYEKKWI